MSAKIDDLEALARLAGYVPAETNPGEWTKGCRVIRLDDFNIIPSDMIQVLIRHYAKK